MESMLMRHVGALRHAMHPLDTYYREYSTTPPLPLLNPTHPYPTSFVSRDGSVQHFTYLYRMTGRNLFFGRMDDTAICVKFVPRYCKEGHEFLAAKGLRRNSMLSSAFLEDCTWFMDDVSDKYVSLFNLIRDNLSLLSEEHLGSRDLLSENACGRA